MEVGKLAPQPGDAMLAAERPAPWLWVGPMAIEVSSASVRIWTGLPKTTGMYLPIGLVAASATNEYLVATVGGETGGTHASVGSGVDRHMEMIRVLDTHQRTGVGTALVVVWEAAMRSQGAKLLMTLSMSDEPELQAWHRRNGFMPSGSLTFGRVEPTPEVFFVRP